MDKDLLIANLDRIHSSLDKLSDKLDSKSEKLNDKIEEVRIANLEQSKDIAVLMAQVPNLKASLDEYKAAATPAVEHIMYLKGLPKQVFKAATAVGKVVGAITVVVGAIGGAVASCSHFIK